MTYKRHSPTIFPEVFSNTMVSIFRGLVLRVMTRAIGYRFLQGYLTTTILDLDEGSLHNVMCGCHGEEWLFHGKPLYFWLSF